MDSNIIVLSTGSNIAEVPDYIKVLPLGLVSSEKGDFIVDKNSFLAMTEYLRKRKVDIVIDYEHQTLESVQAPAGGWIKTLILKEDGIYAKVEWTDKAKQYLLQRAYRYLSPVVLVNKADKRVTQLHSVALTNTPAINGMTPIINSLKTSSNDKIFLTDIQKEICRMTGISKEDFGRQLRKSL